MAKQQRTAVAPPIEGDKDLSDFSSVIQSNLEDLFNASHEHTIRTTVPPSNEGTVGDMVLVYIAPSWYIYAKVDATTWKHTAALI